MDAMTALAQFQPSAVNPWGHLGSAHATAYSPSAPPDEVQDASMQLARTYLQDLGVMGEIPDAQVVRDWDRLRQAEKTGDRLLAKALRKLNPQAAEAKARTEALYATVGGGGLWLSKPGIPFEALRAMSTRIEVAQAIHLTRRRQVAKFGELATRDDQVGFRIRHADPNHKPTDDDQAYDHWLARFLMNGGRDFRPHERRRSGRQTLRDFLAGFVDESHTHDNVAIETIPLRGMDGLDSFYLRDGATFYRATASDDVYAYQSLSGMPDAAFGYDEMVLFSRNTSPDVHRRGYGRSELEASVETMTLFLQALEFTRAGMDDNAIPRGILTVFGQFDRRQEEAFRSAWASKVRGVRNRHGLPVLFSRNGQAAANFTATGADFSEMAFAKWISLQASIMCAIYGIDPKEIHIEGFGAGNTSSLSGNDTQEKLTQSKETGQAAFLGAAEALISDEILGRFATDRRIQFSGIDGIEAQVRRQREDKAMTINELRESLQMPRHPLGWFGDLPSDQALLTAEFQRMEKTLTFGESRQVWGGLPAYPKELLNAAPLNANLQAQYNQLTQPEPEPDPMTAGDPWEGMGDGLPGEDGQDGEGGQEESQPLPEGGVGAQAKAALQALKQGGGDA